MHQARLIRVITPPEAAESPGALGDGCNKRAATRRQRTLEISAGDQFENSEILPPGSSLPVTAVGRGKIASPVEKWFKLDLSGLRRAPRAKESSANCLDPCERQ